MANKITYANKEYLINDETIPDKNKVLDTDLNEIKEVVNNNADELDTATANIEELQGTVESQGSAINELQEDNTNNKANIQENTTDISNIKAEQTTQNTRLGDLETDNATNKSNISTNTQNIATLQLASAHKIELNLNNTTYILTATLKNKAGTVLSTDTIDLPLETMVVNGSYNSTTKKVVLTLQNGNTVEFSVADLINGLVSQTDFDDLEDRVETNEGNIDTLQGKVSNIETEQTTQNEQIEDNTNNITDLQEKTQELIDQIPEGTAEGTFITLNDSSDLDFVDFVVEGDTEQETREGYNKFNVDDISQGYFTGNEGNINTSSVGIYTNEYLDVGNNKNIYILIEALQQLRLGRFFIQEYDENKNSLQRTSSGVWDTIFSSEQKRYYSKELLENTKYIRFCAYVLQEYENDTYTSINVKENIKDFVNICCSFSYQENYESYGAMPSPDYPSDVQVITGDVEVEVVGKNIANLNILNKVPDTSTGEMVNYNNAASSNFTEIDNSEDYTFSYKFINENETTQRYIMFYDENYNYLGYVMNLTDGYRLNNSQYFGNTKYFKLRVDNLSRIKYIQLEQNSIATEYEPYHEQTQLLSLGDMELCKIGEYRDYIYESEGKWYKYKAIEKNVISDTTVITQTGENSRFNLFFGGKSTYYNGNVNQSGTISNYYKAKYAIEHGNVFSSATYGAIAVIDNRFTTTEEFREWALGKLVTYRILAIPVIEEITDPTLIAQLNELKKLHTYKNITNINTSTEGLKPILKMTYKKDLETLFNKLDNLENRLALLEG